MPTTGSPRWSGQIPGNGKPTKTKSPRSGPPEWAYERVRDWISHRNSQQRTALALTALLVNSAQHWITNTHPSRAFPEQSWGGSASWLILCGGPYDTQHSQGTEARQVHKTTTPLSLVDTDAKILDKILINGIQQCIKGYTPRPSETDS